jgi:hypothetical protein
MDNKKQSEKSLQREILKQMVTLSTSGFGLVAALAWNNVIQEVVNTYIKPYLANGSGILSLVIYAVGITILAVTVTYSLSKLVNKLDNLEKRKIPAAPNKLK